MGEYFFLNGKIISSSEAILNVTDLALLRGFGIFDFLRTHKQKPFLKDLHLKRLYNSARYVDLEIPYNQEEISEIVDTLLRKNNIYEAGVRIVLTGGYTLNGFTPSDEPNFIILVEKINFPSQEKYDHGVKLYFYEHLRELNQIKSINYLTPIALRYKIEKEQCFDVLYHFNGKILELSRSNFFIIKDRTIITPDKNILLGITRASLLNLAKDYYKTEEREVDVEELKHCDEAFMTGTTKKVLPVIQVGTHLIGAGTPGPVTRHLMQLFADFEDQQSY